MIFIYKGIKKDFSKHSGTLDALNEQEAKIRLNSMDFIAYQVSQKRNFRWQKTGFSNAELSFICKNIAAYLKGGILLIDAIKLMQEQFLSHKLKALFFKKILNELHEGKSFYSALQIQSISKLPHFFIEGVGACEKRGILDEVLLEMSVYLKEISQVSKKVKQALIYPSFILSVSIFAIFFMLYMVVPQILSIYESNDAQLPEVTTFVLSLSESLRTNFLWIVGGILGVVVVIWGMLRWQKGRLFLHIWALRTPILGVIIKNFELGRFCFLSSVLFKSGMPLTSMLRIIAKAVNNEALKKEFFKLEHLVNEGKNLSSAVKEVQIDTLFSSYFSMAQQRADIDQSFLELSKIFFERNSEKIDLLLVLLSPILLLLIGSFVALIIAAMLLPIFSISIV